MPPWFTTVVVAIVVIVVGNVVPPTFKTVLGEAVVVADSIVAELGAEP